MLICNRKQIQVEGRNIRWHFKSRLMSAEEGLGHDPAPGYHGCGSKHRFGVHPKELAVFIDTGGERPRNSPPWGPNLQKRRSSASAEQSRPWHLRNKLKETPFPGCSPGSPATVGRTMVQPGSPELRCEEHQIQRVRGSSAHLSDKKFCLCARSLAMEQAELSVSLLLKRLLGSGEDGNKSHDQQANPGCLPLFPGATLPPPARPHLAHPITHS